MEVAKGEEPRGDGYKGRSLRGEGPKKGRGPNREEPKRGKPQRGRA